LTGLVTEEPLVSIVVPTFNEVSTIGELLGQLSASLPPGVPSEIVVVDDDSPDGTSRAVTDYAERRGEVAQPSVRLIVRRDERGLGTAIVRGIEESRGRYVVVMDADLSHPPSVVPQLLEPLLNGKCDLVVASRNARGGAVVGWPLTRRLTSWGATKIAKGIGLGVEDPMSGFFAFDRRIIKGVQFYAVGFKILPEILAKARGIRVEEIPFIFVNRKTGTSKLGAMVIINYLRMSWKLYQAKRANQD
jgi:dolichol-phosphate mannosyltransferase